MRIPDRLLQLIGGAYILYLGWAAVQGLIEGIREGGTTSGDTPRDVPLMTSHPRIPTNMFSATLEMEKNPELRRHLSHQWLLTFGDKICHTTASLLTYLLMGIKVKRAGAQTGLFPLYLEAALVETRLMMDSQGVKPEKGDAMLNCISATVIDTPLTGLKRYAGLLELAEDERCESVALEAAQMVGAAPRDQRHFRAAYVLLRTVVLVMCSQMS